MQNCRAVKKSMNAGGRFVALFGLVAFCGMSLLQAASFASVSLRVTVLSTLGLTITHTPEPVVYFEDYLSVPVVITAPAGNGISRVLLHYRRKGRLDYVTAQGNDAFQPIPSGRPSYQGQATIPGDFLTGSGVEYYIEAFDLSGLPSYAGTSAAPFSTELAGAGSVAAGPYSRDIGPAGDQMLLPDGNPNDGNTSLQVGSGVLPSVMTFTIAQKDKTNPTIVPPGAGRAVGRAAAAYQFGGGPTVLAQPVRISLLYADRDATSGVVDGTSISESLLRLFYWDGSTWRLVGGTVDTVLNTVNAWVPRLGLYALFSISDLSAKIFAPAEKVITPNGDGKNDKAFLDRKSVV